MGIYESSPLFLVSYKTKFYDKVYRIQIKRILLVSYRSTSFLLKIKFGQYEPMTPRRNITFWFSPHCRCLCAAVLLRIYHVKPVSQLAINHLCLFVTLPFCSKTQFSLSITFYFFFFSNVFLFCVLPIHICQPWNSLVLENPRQQTCLILTVHC